MEIEDDVQGRRYLLTMTCCYYVTVSCFSKALFLPVLDPNCRYLALPVRQTDCCLKGYFLIGSWWWSSKEECPVADNCVCYYPEGNGLWSVLWLPLRRLSQTVRRFLRVTRYVTMIHERNNTFRECNSFTFIANLTIYNFKVSTPFYSFTMYYLSFAALGGAYNVETGILYRSDATMQRTERKGVEMFKFGLVLFVIFNFIGIFSSLSILLSTCRHHHIIFISFHSSLGHYHWMVHISFSV